MICSWLVRKITFFYTLGFKSVLILNIFHNKDSNPEREVFKSIGVHVSDSVIEREHRISKPYINDRSVKRYQISFIMFVSPHIHIAPWYIVPVTKQNSQNTRCSWI